MLGSYATALHALSRQPSLLNRPELRTRCRQLLENIDITSTLYRDQIRQQGTYPPNYFPDGALLVSVPACNSLCESIVSLARADALPLDDNLTLLTLLGHLIETLQGEPFHEGRTALQDLREGGSSGTAESDGKWDSGVSADKKDDGRIIEGEGDIEYGGLVAVGTSTVMLSEVCGAIRFLGAPYNSFTRSIDIVSGTCNR